MLNIHFHHPHFSRLFFCFVCFSHLEQNDTNNDSTDLGNLVIPEISVTNVSGDRVGNGERVKSLTETDAQNIQAMQDNCSEARAEGKPEIRRQKSVRRLMEDGMTSPGRVQC